jgi:hypothetical protein
LSELPELPEPELSELPELPEPELSDFPELPESLDLPDRSGAGAGLAGAGAATRAGATGAFDFGGLDGATGAEWAGAGAVLAASLSLSLSG